MRYFLLIPLMVLGTIVSVNCQEIPLPMHQKVLPHFSGIVTPVTGGTAIESYPVGVGDVAAGGSIMNLQVDLNRFSAGVDMYLALSFSEIPGMLLFLDETGTFVPMDSHVPVWKKNVTRSISHTIFRDIPAEMLPQGTFTFFLVVTPHARFDRYYLWTTSFDTATDKDPGADPFQEGILVLNEISPWPADGTPWIELLNPTNHPVSLNQWRLFFRSNSTDGLKLGSGEIPAGEMHVISIPPEVRLNPDGDGCVLSGPMGDIDAVSWGRPMVSRKSRLSSGAPVMPEKAVYLNDEPIFAPDSVCIRIPGTWSLGSRDWIDSAHWRIRPAGESSRGRGNPLPGPLVRLPEKNSRIASSVSLFATGLNWADGIQFQVARDAQFQNILVDEVVRSGVLTLDTLPSGIYHWRLRITSPRSGPWSPPWQFTRLAFDLDTLPAGLSAAKNWGKTLQNETASDDPRIISRQVIGLPHIIQRKDTDMVCLDGCPESGDFNWQDLHPGGTGNQSGGHSDMYCARASLSMFAAAGGCTLSQDRISYYIFEESGSSRAIGDLGHAGDPFQDLGHGTGVRGEDIMMSLEWLYGQPPGTSTGAVHSAEAFDNPGTETMNSIVAFINDGRPVIRAIPGHATVCDGYAVIRYENGREERFLHVLDPWHANGVSWISFPETMPGHYYIFPPPAGSPMRCDEPEIAMDSDGDGLVDFDEIRRFGTDPTGSDSDGDGLDDMKDMYGYLFDLYGNYDLRERDMDGDGLPKELDPDNDRKDNDGLNDGCEDANRDGWYNPGGSESDNFDPDDDFTVLSPVCFNGYIRLDSRATVPAAPSATVYVVEQLVISKDQPVISDHFIYKNAWRLTADPVILEVPNFGTLRSETSGAAEILCNLAIEVDISGHYRMVTDCEPRMTTYIIHTTGPGVSTVRTEDFFVGLADHHYEYLSPLTPPEIRQMLEQAGKPNVFEGEVIIDGDRIRLAGSDRLYDMEETLYGSLDRTWEIWIDLPDGR